MTRSTKRPPLIFTDLEGTLLEPDNREWHAAMPALNLAREQHIPVIPCSSKTFMECLRWMEKLDLNGPFIFENGGGVALPSASFTPPDHPRVELVGDHWLYSFGEPYYAIRRTLESLRAATHYQFRGFGDMSSEQIRNSTGLSEDEAELAKLRRHSEPLLWLDNAKAFDQFTKEINRTNLRMTRGGRFVHITGAHDKGQAMVWLAALYYQRDQKLPFVIALGDSDYDLPMLKLAHAAVIVRPSNRAPLELTQQTPNQIIMTTELIGSQGWNQAVTTLLNQ